MRLKKILFNIKNIFYFFIDYSRKLGLGIGPNPHIFENIFIKFILINIIIIIFNNIIFNYIINLENKNI